MSAELDLTPDQRTPATVGDPAMGEAPAAAAPAAGAPGRRSYGANIAALATSQAITWSMALLWTFIVPRLIGPDAMGELVIATSLTFVVAVALSVMPKDYLVRELVASPGRARRVLATALVTRAGVIPLVFLAAFGYGQLADLTGRAMTVMYIVAGATCAAMLLEPALAAFQATERMQYIAYTDVGNKTLQTVGGVVLALAGLGVVAIAGFTLVVALLALTMALVWANRLVGVRARPLRLPAVVRAAAPYWFVSVFYVTYLWADGFLLGILVPAEVVGWYGAATRLFTTMTFVASIIATASLPRLVQAHARGHRAMVEVARQPVEWAVILGLPIGVGVACIAGDLIPLLYGADYAGAVVPLTILAGLGLPLMYMNIMVSQLFVASGRPQAMGWLLAGTALLNVSLNLALIPLAQQQWGNGGIGAAVSLVGAELVQLVVGLSLMGRHLLSRGTVRRIGSALLAVTGMAVVVRLGADLPIALQAALGAATYLGLCLLLRVPTAPELAAVRRRMRGRA